MSPITTRPAIILALALLPMGTALTASAQVVSLGNLVSTNSVQTLNVTGLTGGPYNRVTFTTNWSANTSGTFSQNVAFNFNITPSFYGIIASLSSISGFNPNNTPVSMTAVCNLSMPVSSATALQMIRAQYPSPAFTSTNWDNTVLNFSYYQRPRAIPTGIRNLAVRGDTNSPFSISTGGTVGSSPAIGLYSSEGYLLASNVGAASSSGTTTPTGLLVTQPAVDPGLSNLFLPEGEYFVFVGGEGTTFTSDDMITNVPSTAAGFTLGGSIGSGGWTDPSYAAGEGGWYSFTIVPTPASTAALALLGVTVIRRRR